MYNGWHQVAFRRDLVDELTPVWIGRRPLVLVDRPEGVAAFDAACPHRGANLAYGGRVDGDVVVCPFHGHRIALGTAAPHTRYRVRGYTTLEFGGCIFVLVAERHENGLSRFLEGLVDTHVFVPGFSLSSRVAPEYVIENAFDAEHFKAVHGLERTPRLGVERGEDGEMIVEGTFETSGANPWQDDGDGGPDEPSRSRFCAHVFSPTLVASELGDPGGAHVVITSATPSPDGGSIIRLSLAVRKGPTDDADARVARSLLFGSKTAFEQDLAVWDHLVPDVTPDFGPGDKLVLQFHDFCTSFADGRA